MPSLLPASTWDKLLEDIARRKSVLLVGPELFNVQNTPVQRHVRRELLDGANGEVAFFYEAEGLFLFENEEAKSSIANRVKRIYRKIEPPQDLFSKILQVPFPLIISLNPDTWLPAFSREFGISHHFRHLKIYEEGVTDEMPAPGEDDTLIFNLCGCMDDDESLVLDYKDLFDLLRLTLSKNGLPLQVQKLVNEAKSFLFLGFQFDKWYSQLLLQLFTGGRKMSSKTAIDTTVADQDAQNFVLKQFSIKFAGNGSAFFEELFRQCENTPEVRLRQFGQAPPRADWQAAVRAVQDLLAGGEFGEACDQLDALARGTRWEKEALALCARWRSLKKDRHAGILDSRDEASRQAALIRDTFELLDKMLN